MDGLLGDTQDLLLGLASDTANPRCAWDSYRRFVQMYGNVVIGIPGERFEQAIAGAKAERDVRPATRPKNRIV